jgi:signal transduction histidine kinase
MEIEKNIQTSRKAKKNQKARSLMNVMSTRRHKLPQKLEGAIHAKGIENLKAKKRKETSHSGEKDLKRLERENRLLVEQLIEASTFIKNLEDKFQEASRKQIMGRVLVAGLLHDLRNPLAVISSCAQSSLEALDLSPSLKENLRMIMESGKKAHELIKKFLDYTKSSILEYKPVNVNELVLRTWEMAKLESAPCFVTFEPLLKKGLIEIIASSENLERVFLNLFLNAIQAVSKKGKIIVQTRFLSSQDMVEINIIDDGPGIPEENLQRIFDPFFTTKEGGTGLGLQICQSLIQQHKGSITIHSNGGQGTTVCIRMPVTQDEVNENSY